MHVTSCIERASTVGRRVEAAGVERRSASEGVVLKADAAATRVATRATATLTCIGEISVKTFAKFGPLPKMKSTACCAVWRRRQPTTDFVPFATLPSGCAHVHNTSGSIGRHFLRWPVSWPRTDTSCARERHLLAAK